MTDPFVGHYLLTDLFVDLPTQSSHQLLQPPTHSVLKGGALSKVSTLGEPMFLSCHFGPKNGRSKMSPFFKGHFGPILAQNGPNMASFWYFGHKRPWIPQTGGSRWIHPGSEWDTSWLMGLGHLGHPEMSFGGSRTARNGPNMAIIG